MIKFVAIAVGLVLGLYIASPSESMAYGAQTADSMMPKYIAAVAAIAVGLYLFRTASQNPLANFAAYALLMTGFAIFLGPYVIPQPVQPVPPAATYYQS